MEKDPSVVARLAAQGEDENWRFRTFLKASARLSPARVDALAERLGRDAQAAMDCTSCAACCRDNWIPVTDQEVDRLARRLGLAVAQFRQRYVTIDEHEPADEQQGIQAKPCPFLDGNLCAVYEDRPEPCRGYPYVGGSIASRMIGIIERAGTCPIVFEMLERLKDQLGFRRFC